MNGFTHDHEDIQVSSDLSITPYSTEFNPVVLQVTEWMRRSRVLSRVAAKIQVYNSN